MFDPYKFEREYSVGQTDIGKYVVTDISSVEIKPVISWHPENFSDDNLNFRFPHSVYIGPGLRRYDRQHMDEKKYPYFKFFCQRLGQEYQQELEVFTTMLANEEENIRNFYSENYDSRELSLVLRIILLDAVFVMELFLRRWEGPPVINDDYLFANYVLSESIKRDLLLIKNQIPFFVFEKLYHLVPRGSHSSFLELARKYFSSYNPYPWLSMEDINREMKLKPGWDKPKHFIDMIRYFLLPNNLNCETDFRPNVKPASKLKLAGITFEPVSGGCLLDVKFKKIPILNRLSCLLCNTKWAHARLQIPTLKVDSSTECILSNLIAFEKQQDPIHCYISNYVTLLAYLIEKREDLDLLVESGVIVNGLPPYEDLLGPIERLVKESVKETSVCHAALLKKLEEHYNDRWNRGMATIRLVYFKDASRTAATISGLIILAFSIVSLFSALKELNVKLFS